MKKLNLETPFERKSCYDCAHIRAIVNLWCGNKEAVKARGTAIPGVIHCPYWAPDYRMIKKEEIPYEEKYGYTNPMETKNYRAFPPNFIWIVILFLSFFSGMAWLINQ